jgi:hypothetical protein
MQQVTLWEGSTSPIVRSITRTVYVGSGIHMMVPDGCWDIAIIRNSSGTLVLRTGQTTRPVPFTYRDGDEVLAISFRASTFMPLMSGESMRDKGVALGGIGKDRFWLGTDVVEIPTFDNVDGFVERLLRNELVQENGLVASVVSGNPAAATTRTMQRHFLKTTGLTPKAYSQIDRAQKAVELLRSGQSAADVAFSLGFSDQPHLIRSLQAITGRTPRQIASAAFV